MYENQNPQYNFSTLEPKPPKKKKRTASIVAIALAICVLGAGSGFGGAYLANTLASEHIVSQKPQEPENPEQTTAEPENDIPANTTEPYQKPDEPVSDDLSSLENLANGNTTVELDAAELFEKVHRSIVIVTNYRSATNTTTGEQALRPYSTGSGVIFTSDGYIVTNAHVISGAVKLSVTVEDGISENEEFEAVVVGSDSATDLAVLKISREKAFFPAALGDSDTLKCGQEVCAIGNPSTLNKTITQGIISGLGRYYATSAEGYALPAIQTDAPINPGNSGGGLFDMYGNVIGIVNSKSIAENTENLGFAITINEAKPVLSDLINYGVVKGRPMLGVTTSALSQYSAYLYGADTPGLLVTSISENSNAAKSDLRIGDIIVAIDGTEVMSVNEVQSLIKNKKTDDYVTVTVVRVEESVFGYTAGSRRLDIKLQLSESGTY